jgi:hypothetical protein
MASGRSSVQIICSSSARSRLAASRAFINKFPPSTELIVVGATRGAADDFARDASRGRATFGLHRFSLVELAARAAALNAAATGRVAGTQTNSEAMAARASFDAAAAGDLPYFSPVAATPGFPKALARTVHELRLASIDSGELARAAPAGPAIHDLIRLLDRIDGQLANAAVSDRALLFSMAAGPAIRCCSSMFL